MMSEVRIKEDDLPTEERWRDLALDILKQSWHRENPGKTPVLWYSIGAREYIIKEAVIV